MKDRLTRAHQKSLARLHMKKYRDADGLFLVSGLRAVTGALELSPEESVQEILLRSDQEHLTHTSPFNRFKSKPVFVGDETAFRTISDERQPQGVALVMRKPTRARLSDERPMGATYYLHEVSDPGNLGAIIRTAAWFNVMDIFLSSGSVDPYSPKCVRATAGTILKPRIWEDITADDLASIREKGCVLLATDVRDGRMLSSLEKSRASLILMGSEAHGLPDEIQGLAEQTLHIPGTGSGESLNLATATAIIMYHLHT